MENNQDNNSYNKTNINWGIGIYGKPLSKSYK